MIESDATRLAMIKAVGGVRVLYDGGSFYAVYDREFSLSQDGAVESRQPVLNARTSDVEQLMKDDVVTVGTEQFRVKRHEPDGTGMTLVILKR